MILVATFCLGCSGAASSRAGNGSDPARESAKHAASSSKGKHENSVKKSGVLKFDKVSPRAVTAMKFVHEKLAIGFSDGGVAIVDVGNGEVFHSKVAKVHSVAAVSPGGDLALLDANPPVIVNMAGDLILQMNTVPSFESAVFGNDNITLYVADKDGKVRIWGQPHSFEEDQHKEKLENYLNRQAPDFHVEFPPIRGPIHVTDTNKLIVVDAEGTVRIWDPTRPSGSKRIMKVGGGARSIASADGNIFVTSQTGALKVGKDDGSGYLPWSKDTRAAFVAAGPMTAGTFFTLDAGMLESRNTQTGEVAWSTKIPDGYPCGLDLDPNGNVVAACIGNFVATFDATSGAPLAYGYRADGDFTWNR